MCILLNTCFEIVADYTTYTERVSEMFPNAREASSLKEQSKAHTNAWANDIWKQCFGGCTYIYLGI
jgi:hypothetical protein